MQRGISFLEKQRPQAKVGPEARKWVPQEPRLGEWFQISEAGAAGGGTWPRDSLGLWRWGQPHRRWDALRTRNGQSSRLRAALCWATGKLKNVTDLRGSGTEVVPDPQGMCEGDNWPLWCPTQHKLPADPNGEVALGEEGGGERRGEGRGAQEWGRGEINTLSRALIFAPLFSSNFKTSRFPPRLAQWRAVDSSYTRR